MGVPERLHEWDKGDGMTGNWALVHKVTGVVYGLVIGWRSADGTQTERWYVIDTGLPNDFKMDKYTSVHGNVSSSTRSGRDADARQIHDTWKSDLGTAWPPSTAQNYFFVAGEVGETTAWPG